MEENIVDSLGKKIGQLRLALEMHDTARGGDGSGVVRTRETQTMERIIPNLLHIVPNMIWDLIAAWMTGDSYFAYKTYQHMSTVGGMNYIPKLDGKPITVSPSDWQISGVGRTRFHGVLQHSIFLGALVGDDRLGK